jgi:3-oxoacyl-[acyl-carrier protein] reductase
LAPTRLEQRSLDYQEGKLIIQSQFNCEAKQCSRSLYTTFKSALEGLARAWADELGANPELEFMKGTTANTVAVGFTETDMVSKMPPAMREAVNQNVLAKQSLGPRAALPEDIADVVGFLCGPDSRWVTGSVVSADAGMVKIM